MLLSVLKRIFVTPAPRAPLEQPAPIAASCMALLQQALEQGREDEAQRVYRHALAAAHDDPQALLRLGELLLVRGRAAQALEPLRTAAAALPSDPLVRFRLAGACLANGMRAEGFEHMRQAAAMGGGFVPALNDLGNFHKEDGALDEAEACYRDALERDPGFAVAWHNLGCVLRDKGDIGGALECVERALALAPDYPDAQLTRALLLLGMGRLEEGWRGYRSRWDIPERRAQKRPFPYPEWRGEPLDGRSILVWGEQGVGDELLFASLVEEVGRMSSRCVLECYPKLVPLLTRSLPSVEVVARRTPPDPRLGTGFDYQIAVGDLGAILRDRLDRFPEHRGYLRADPQRVAHWRGRLRAIHSGLQVGIGWRTGDVSGERGLTCTRLEDWREVFAVPGVQFVCLQYDVSDDELDSAARLLGVEIRRFPEVDLFDDLDETAALMSALDFVISTYTAVAIQAAALGVETWCLSYGFDWQRHGTENTPWLPAVTMFRRPWTQPWQEFCGSVGDRLRRRVALELAARNERAAADRAAADEYALTSRLLTNPLDRDALYALASLAAKQGRVREAVGLLRRAIDVQPRDAAAHLLRAQLTRDLGWWDEAIDSLRVLQGLEPENATVLANLGTAYEAKGDLTAAEGAYRRAAALQPGFAAVHLNLGNVLRARGDNEGARAAYEAALVCDPRSTKAHVNLASLYKLRGNLGAAERHLRQAVALEPANARLLLGLGATLHDAGRVEEAIQLYEEALRHDPELQQARLNLGFALLLRGDLARGWPLLDVRFEVYPADCQRRFGDIPAWRGEPIAGKRLLVWAEQGIGDEILFASLIPDLRAYGCEVTLECHPKLLALFARSFPEARVVARGRLDADAARTAFDVQIAAGSLPEILRPTLAAFPNRASYLVADEERCRYWRARVQTLGPGMKVGFCWRSSNLEGERALSCTKLEEWSGLFAREGVHWVCLQYDDCAAELAALKDHERRRVHRFDGVDYRDDLDEVSALMKALDLVVSAPTAVSIHAAAVGVPTWQLSYGADWQTHGRTDNPWLPSMRRFPRAWTESWQEVFERIGAELDRLRAAA